MQGSWRKRHQGNSRAVKSDPTFMIGFALLIGAVLGIGVALWLERRRLVVGIFLELRREDNAIRAAGMGNPNVLHVLPVLEPQHSAAVRQRLF